MKKSRIFRLTALLTAAALLCGCASGQPANQTDQKKGSYQVPEFRTNEFHEDQAVDSGAVQTDLSQLKQGIVGVRASGSTRLKFQISCGEEKYSYDLPGDGTTVFFPLNMGDGSYTFRLMEQVEDTKYTCSWTETREVTLGDEFQPFLRASQIVSYTQDSNCVEKAKEMAADCATDSDLASAVYQFLVEEIEYDQEKAKSVEGGYLPNPDETLASGKGICFDYASLAAAMLRSMGIPCKVITGYVNESTYHAWNSFYLENQGWITAEIQVNAKQWQRVDITFAAGGMSEKQLEENQYTTRYVY